MNMNHIAKLLSRGAVALVIASLYCRLSAQSPATPSAGPGMESPANPNLSHADRKFLRVASESGLKEVTISQEVLPRLSDPRVRDFAQMMVTDHGSANSQLAQLASRKGVEVPSVSPKVEQKWADKTSDLDEDYIKAMVKDHDEAVELFEKAAKSDDPEIASFAQQTLPTLRHHLAMARDLKKSTK